MEVSAIVWALLCAVFFVLYILSMVAAGRRLKVVEKLQGDIASLTDRLRDSKKEIVTLRDKNLELCKRVEELEPFQDIVDVATEAARQCSEGKRIASEIIEKAKRSAYKTISDAQELEERIKRERNQVLAEAREKAKATKDKAEWELDIAVTQAEGIIQQARTQAEEIAGDALKAKGQASLYEAAAKAARNVIKGYGDEYVMPNESVLDDLAEEFSHKEAGQKLKEVRAHIKVLIKRELAAECDYVETNRRETAIRFVLDAYNGKVDSAMTKVKHDNFGKIAQHIEDALQLVNYNGAAFRNARITDALHKSRLDELKWAVATHELKLIEREEQKAIREQMREEERARREYEKARKEAEKEEKMLQKALAEARKHLEAANEQERQAFQQELEQLQAKLVEAESKNERALSMAQQTRAGHVYVISNIGSFGEEVFKVGMTRRLEPMDRVKELGDASVPFSFDVHAMIYSDDAPTLEKELHRRFHETRLNKINYRKEFFRVPALTIREAVEELDLDVHFTMSAEAREYRESIALAAGHVSDEPAVKEQEAFAMA